MIFNKFTKKFGIKNFLLKDDHLSLDKEIIMPAVQESFQQAFLDINKGFLNKNH